MRRPLACLIAVLMTVLAALHGLHGVEAASVGAETAVLATADAANADADGVVPDGCGFCGHHHQASRPTVGAELIAAAPRGLPRIGAGTSTLPSLTVPPLLEPPAA